MLIRMPSTMQHFHSLITYIKCGITGYAKLSTTILSIYYQRYIDQTSHSFQHKYVLSNSSQQRSGWQQLRYLVAKEMEYAAFSCVDVRADLIIYASQHQKYSTFLPFRSQQRRGRKKKWRRATETEIAGMLLLSHLFGVYIYTVSLKLVWSFLLNQNQKGSFTQ